MNVHVVPIETLVGRQKLRRIYEAIKKERKKDIYFNIPTHKIQRNNIKIYPHLFQPILTGFAEIMCAQILILLYSIDFFWSNATTCPCGLRGPPSWAWQECNRLLRLGRP